jgi:hypothetical protein
MSQETIDRFERAILAATDAAIKAAADECLGGCNAGDILIVAAVRAFCMEHGDSPRDLAFQDAWRNYAEEVMLDEEFGGITYRKQD